MRFQVLLHCFGRSCRGLVEAAEHFSAHHSIAKIGDQMQLSEQELQK